MLKLMMKTDSAAFEERNEDAEVSRLLREIADKIDAGRVDGVIMDANGNRIGSWDYSPEYKDIY